MMLLHFQMVSLSRMILLSLRLNITDIFTNVKHSAKIILKNNLPEIHRLAAEINKFGAETGLNDEMIFNIDLALEEIITNIISYAYADDKEHEIIVELNADDKLLTVRIEDDGKEFNISGLPEPDIEKPLEEREIGGLGCFFVRNLMDDLIYERIENKNILTLIKNVK